MFIVGLYVMQYSTYGIEGAMKYRHVLLTRFAEPEQAFQIVEDDLFEPGRGQVRVKILATGLAYADVMMRKGFYPGMPRLPFTPGYDMVGIVDAVGPDIHDFSVGQMVAALTVFGSYSQYICLSTEFLVPVPSGVDPVEASNLPLNYVTAYQLLHRVARVKAGERILVYGAAGGVGTALLQLGKLAGLQVYGVASSSKQDLVMQLGAVPLDYKQEDIVERVRALTGDGVDAVFDAIGGAHLTQSFRTLRKGGRLVSFGMSSIPAGTSTPVALVRYVLPLLLRLVWWSVLPNARKAVFSDMGTTRKRHPAWIREDLAILLGLLAEGKIAPIIGKRLPLEDVVLAHMLLEHGQVEGKLVLLPNQ
jgi:NADPH:quinone reductase-like Zn-dependent oxidoreductase